MTRKVLISSLLVLTTTFLLTGCSGISKTEETYTFDNPDYKNTSYPQWSESSATFLKKAGWTINAPASEFLSEYNIAIPNVIYAGSPDNKCIIKYDVNEIPASAATIDSYFLANQYLQNNTFSNYANMKITKYSTDNIKVKNAGTVEMLDINFNFVSPEQLQEFSTKEEAEAADIKTVPGTGARIGRVFTTPLTNPYAPLYLKEAPNEKVFFVANITYSCNGSEINNDIWKQVIAKAELNFDPLPIPSGAPIIPEPSSTSGVPERQY